MADLVRASSLTGVRDLITEFGKDPDVLFRDSGIDPGTSVDYDAVLPYTRLAELIGRSAAVVGAAHFGLLLSERQDIRMFGPIAILLRNAADVEEALRGLIRYLYTYTPAVDASLDVGARTTSFRFRYRVRPLPRPEQITELTMAVVINMIRLLTSSDFTPTAVHLTHAQISSDAVYASYLGWPVTFGAHHNELVFDSSHLGSTIEGDQLAHDLAVKYLSSQRHADDLVSRVGEMVEQLLPLGQADLRRTARALTMHPRTLQRRLDEEGTHFDEVLDDARRRMASGLITDSELPLSMIAQQVGYAEQSCLSRSCRRWFSMSARQLRQQHRQSDPSVQTVR